MAKKGQFSLAVHKWVEETKANADQVCRAIALSLSTRIILASPVGNPELWAANAEAALQRSQHNDVVDQITANLLSNPANVGPRGGLKRNVRSQYNKRLSKSQLAKEYPLRQGKGYVGGLFRGNWQITIGAASAKKLNRIDPSGNEAIASASAALSAFTAGPRIFLCNNLPYGPRLEYEGWSKQAPAGMVRISLAAVDAIVSEAVRSVQ